MGSATAGNGVLAARGQGHVKELVSNDLLPVCADPSGPKSTWDCRHAHVPVDVDDSAELGLAGLYRPDFGKAVAVDAGEIPISWTCGLTLRW